MRLSAITWRDFGMSPDQMAARYRLKFWLESNGARVSCWMLVWTIQYE